MALDLALRLVRGYGLAIALSYPSGVWGGGLAHGDYYLPRQLLGGGGGQHLVGSEVWTGRLGCFLDTYSLYSLRLHIYGLFLNVKVLSRVKGVLENWSIVEEDKTFFVVPLDTYCRLQRTERILFGGFSAV